MSRRALVNVLLVLAVVALFAIPVLVDGGASEYGGTDTAVTEELEAGGYTPWFESVFTPAGQVESGLFALQAAIGAGGLGYVLGRLSGRRKWAVAQAAPRPAESRP